MLIDSKYNFGDIVYLVTDEDQNPRMITCMTVAPTGILYELSMGTNTTKHYDIEFSLEQNTELKYKK